MINTCFSWAITLISQVGGVVAVATVTTPSTVATTSRQTAHAPQAPRQDGDGPPGLILRPRLGPGTSGHTAAAGRIHRHPGLSELRPREDRSQRRGVHLDTLLLRYHYGLQVTQSRSPRSQATPLPFWSRPSGSTF